METASTPAPTTASVPASRALARFEKEIVLRDKKIESLQSKIESLKQQLAMAKAQKSRVRRINRANDQAAAEEPAA